MTEPTAAASKRPSGRRAGESRTRASILAAARRLFAGDGADNTSIRAVAQAAGVDPALVMHYFGSKDGLLQAAIEWPLDMSAAMARVIEGDPDELAARIVRLYLQLWEAEETRHPLEIIMRGATSRPADARLLEAFIHDQIVGRLKGVIVAPEAELRGSLIPATLVGLAFARYILRLPPLADLPAEDVVDVVAPTIQRYINGPLRPGRD